MTAAGVFTTQLWLLQRCAVRTVQGCHEKWGSHYAKSVGGKDCHEKWGVIVQKVCVLGGHYAKSLGRGVVIMQKETSPDSYFQVLEFLTLLENPIELHQLYWNYI